MIDCCRDILVNKPAAKRFTECKDFALRKSKAFCITTGTSITKQYKTSPLHQKNLV